MAREIQIDAMTGEIQEVEVEDTIESLEHMKSIRLIELMDTYKIAIVNGFNSSVTGINVRYGYKEQDQLNYSKLANLFALNPNKASTIIGSDSHGVVNLTREQFIKFMDDAEKYEMDMYIKRKTLETKIKNAKTIDELNEISLSF